MAHHVSVTSIVQIQSANRQFLTSEENQAAHLGGCCYECAANENNRYVIEHNISQEEQAAVLAQLASEVTFKDPEKDLFLFFNYLKNQTIPIDFLTNFTLKKASPSHICLIWSKLYLIVR